VEDHLVARPELVQARAEMLGAGALRDPDGEDPVGAEVEWIAEVADARSLSSALESQPYNQCTMIYCVIPRELADELYDKMVEYYKDNPHVTVIVDRREGEDRRKGREYGGNRVIRDRRRARAPGTFPSTDPPETA
jgi:hypothetical protein